MSAGGQWTSGSRLYESLQLTHFVTQSEVLFELTLTETENDI